MEENQVIESNVISKEEEEEEEEGGFDFSGYIPSYKKQNTDINVQKEEKKEVINNDNNVEEFSPEVVNDESDDTLITRETNKEQYLKGLETGNVDTKKHFFFTNIEYAPEHLKGQKHWRNSLGDFLRMTDRAGMAAAQNLTNTAQDLLRMDMPASLAEVISGDPLSAGMMLFKGIKSGIQNKSWVDFFDELGYRAGSNKMSLLDALGSSGGEVKNYQMFDAISAEDRMKGIDYGLFGMPSLTELSGGYPVRDTGRPFADGVTNFLGDGIPFFAIVAGIMAEPTPAGEIVFAKKSLATLKAKSPAFKTFYNMVSKDLLGKGMKGMGGQTIKNVTKFTVKEGLKGSTAGAIAEAFVGNPYQDLGLDPILPDFLDVGNRVDDTYIEAKIKSMVISEVFLGPLFGIGMGGLGVAARPITEPIGRVFTAFKGHQNKKQALNDAMKYLSGINKKANQFKGERRNHLAVAYKLDMLKQILDEGEKKIVEPALNYIVDSTIVRKAAESLGFVYREIDEVQREIDNIKVKNNIVTPEQVTRDTQLNLEKNKIKDEVRAINKEGRKKTKIYEELANEKARIKELEERLLELEKKLENGKNNFVKGINKAEKSEKDLITSMILDNQIRTTQEISAYEKLGVGSGARPKTPLEVQRINPNEIDIRPELFQIKESGKYNPRGVSGSLADQKEFDPRFAGVVSVWKDETGEIGQAGKLYVIDGHNRLDLAKRSQVPEINAQIIQAPDKDAAIVEAAIININSYNYEQKGAVAAIDVAKIIRIQGIRPLMESGLGAKKKIVLEGLQLSRLPDFLFNKLLRGEIGQPKGLAYGSAEIPQQSITDVYKAIEKSNPSIDKIKQAVLMASEATEVNDDAQGVIPAFADYLKTTNAKELLEIRTQIASQLRKKLTRLKAVGTKDKKAGVEQVAGNKINLQNTQDALLVAQKTVDLFNAVAASGGKTTEIIKELAAQVKGKNASRLVSDNLERIQDALQLENKPLFKGSEIVRHQQEIDKTRLETLENMQSETQQKTFNNEELEALSNEPAFKQQVENLGDGQRDSIENQLKTKGVVTNNPSNIEGRALSPLVTNPKARVFPEYFEGSDQNLLKNAIDMAGNVEKFSNFELQDAVERTKRFKLTTKQIKNIQAKKAKYEKANAVYEELDKQIQDLLEGKGKQGNLIELDPDKAETELDKLMAAREAADKERAKFVDERLSMHSDHMKLVSELETRKKDPQLNRVSNAREESLARKTEREKNKEIVDLKKAIDFKKNRGDYKTKKGYNLDEAQKIDNFTFAQYGAELEGKVDNQGKAYGRFYFGKPAPRFNNEIINFVSDLDIAIYTVGKQIANGTSRASKSHYKYVELLSDLGLTNNQILTRYREIVEELRSGIFEIEPPQNYYSSKLLRVISDMEQGMTDIAGRYDYNIDPEDIITGRVNKAKKELDEKILKEYKDVTNPKRPDELGPRENNDFYELIEHEGGELGTEEIYLSLAGVSRAEIQGLMQEVEKISGIDFKLVSDPIITKHNAKSAAAYGVPVGSKIAARGFYRAGQDPLKDLIVVSMIHGQDFANFSAISQTAYHESFHRLFQRYFTKQEHALLKGAEKQLRELAALVKPKMHDKIMGINGYKPLSFEEVVTTAASGYKEALTVYDKKVGKWGKVLDKVYDMVVRVKNFLQGKGFRTWQDLFDDSYSGKIAARGMTPEGAKLGTVGTDETMFEIDADELNNLFTDNLEGLADGSLSIEEVMSNVRRPLINRKWQTKGAKYFIPTSNKNFITANKTINQAMDNMVDAIMQPNQEFPELPAINTQQLINEGMALIEDIDGNVDEVMKIFRKVTKGDQFAQQDLATFMAIKMMRDGNNEMFSVAAINYMQDKSPQNAQLLLATFEDATKLNQAYAKWGRASGQRLSLMGKDVRLQEAQVSIEFMSKQRNVRLTGEIKSIEDALENGIKPTDQGLGEGAYFTSSEVPVTGDPSIEKTLIGTTERTNIIDAAEAGVNIRQILSDMQVNTIIGGKGLNAKQRKAIETFIRNNAADGIRIRGEEIGLEGDIIYIPDVQRANDIIGSKVAPAPEAEQKVTYNRETFQAALADGKNVLAEALDKETYDSILNGTPNDEARKILQALSEINPYLTDPDNGARIMRHINKYLQEAPKPMKANSIVAAFRNFIFLGIKTFTKVAVGSNYRAVMLPFNKQIGAGISALPAMAGKMNDDIFMAQQRQALQGINGFLRAQKHMFHSLYLGMMSFKHDTNFGNIGRGQYEKGVAEGKMKLFEVENQTDLPANVELEPRQKLIERAKGDEWWLSPDSGALQIFTKRVLNTFGTASSRMFSALDTIITSGTAIAQEEIRHIEMIMFDYVKRGIDITDPKVFREIELRAEELTRKSMLDVEMANGDVVRGGFFNSDSMQKTSDYIAFTDDIVIKKDKRTREYAIRRAREKGITDPMELHRFVEEYMQLADPASGSVDTTAANELLPDVARERMLPFTGNNSMGGIDAFPSKALNAIPYGIQKTQQYIPLTGLMFPVNRTPTNIIKGLLRQLPITAPIVDSFWRDINSEDLFVRENAIGEMVTGTVITGLGASLIASGQIQVTGGYGFNRQRREMMMEQRRPAWSIRFRKGDGTYSEWFSLEAFDVLGSLLSISATYKDMLEQMPVEDYMTIDYDSTRGLTGQKLDNEIQRLQDVSIVTAAHFLRYYKAAEKTVTTVVGGQLDKALFQNLNKLLKILRDLSKGNTDMTNYYSGARRPESDYARQIGTGLLIPQFLKAFRRGVDNQRRVYEDSDLPHMFGFIDNTFKEIGTQLPFLSFLFDPAIDEITGMPMTYSSSYDWYRVPNPLHRGILSMLNPLEAFTPTQEKDFGMAGVIYKELNRLHGKGAYPRFISRNILSNIGDPLDDKEFNNFKRIFTSERLDYFGIGQPMTFQEALYYLITQDEKYSLMRDVNPALVATSQNVTEFGQVARKFPERISNERELTKLSRIKEIAKFYKEHAIKVYTQNTQGSGKQISNSIKYMEDKEKRLANRDSLPTYGVDVSLNEWREIINS